MDSLTESRIVPKIRGGSQPRRDVRAQIVELKRFPRTIFQKSFFGSLPLWVAPGVGRLPELTNIRKCFVSCTCDSNFRFQLHQWMGCIQPAGEVLPTADPAQFQFLRMTVDPSYTVNDGRDGGNVSDESVMGVGFIGNEGLLNVFDCVHGRFKGMALPDRIVSVAEQWHPEEIWVERNPFYDLLTDAIRLKAELRNIEIGRIIPFVPVQSKKNRIARLQSLLVPPSIRIYPGAYTAEVLKQVENFCYTSKSNHRREDGLLDVISMLANFR